ncbi:hypothetical protein [Streptomyces sp. NPDC048277]|uniref:hypothetical protein n=1 Tax=Streptomyces sp. NPDC048277 TaxID=3155027 RepID=UPI00340A89EC
MIEKTTTERSAPSHAKPKAGGGLVRSSALVTAATAAGGAGWFIDRVCERSSASGYLSLVAGGLTMVLLFLVFGRLLRTAELRGLPGLG